MTVVSMTEFDDVVEPQGHDRKSSSEKETYSLVIVLKSLVLTTVSNDDPRMVDIALVLGETEAKLNGSLEYLNEQRQGTAISWNRFGEELGRCEVPLAKTNLASFDPPAFEPTIINDTFPIVQESLAIGKIELALKTDRTKSPAEPNGSEPEEDDSMLYIVNDTSPRQSDGYQEDIMRQLLTCKKCNALKSPSEVSYKYELVNGILVSKEYPKKDPDLETMKRKIEQIEREAKLYPVGKEQEAPKEREDHCFCNNCGGYSITGATCSERMSVPNAPMMEAGLRYPEGSAKR
ncbi:hypothetical protein RP20_CCG014856 [Aedes albopictus]|nr:hypothetical protein RP20_CCG014856 [Aedes albopictus]